MKTNFKALFYLKRPKTYVSGPVPVYLRITVAGARVETTTAKECEPAQWNSSAGRMKGTKETVRAFNSYLDNLMAQLDDAHSALTRTEDVITAESLKNKFLGKDEMPRMLIEIFEDHNTRFEKLVKKGEASKGTLSRYRIALAHTQRFLKWKYNYTDISIKKIDHQFITDYDFWLRTERNCANNSTVKYIRNFKKIVLICLENGWLEKNPFLKYKGMTKRKRRVCLEPHELNAIEEKNFSSVRLQQIRDIFLFSCYSGLAYIDIKNLNKENLTNRYDGELWLIRNRQKTDVPTRVPLLTQAIELIQKYEDHPKCANEGLIFPVPSNQKVNDYLKEIAELCGISKVLTFHLARHTFATTVTLVNNVPMESVSVMLGHASIKTTEEYAHVLDIKLSEDMKELREKIKPQKPATNCRILQIVR